MYREIKPDYECNWQQKSAPSTARRIGRIHKLRNKGDLISLGFNNFFAAIVTTRADVMTQVHFTC